jgi:hypothetical protein
MSENLSAAWVGVLIAFFGAALTVTNIHYSRKKDRFNSLSRVNAYLEQAAHREARRVIYYYSPIGEKERAAKGKKPPKIDDILISARIVLGFDFPSVSPHTALKEQLVRVSEDIVRNDMEQMGIMVKSKQFPKEEFLERYWKSVVDCRWLINDNIVGRRNARKYKRYDIDFDNLTIEACNYAKKKDLIKGTEWEPRCDYTVKDGRICYDVSRDCLDYSKGQP